MADASIGAGDLEIELDGKIVVMRPTLEACTRISAIAGGFNGAVQRCLNMDFSMICEIVAVGIGANPRQREKDVPAAVYKTGVLILSAPCIDFIRIVSNGGRPPLDEDEEVDDIAPGEPLPS